MNGFVRLPFPVCVGSDDAIRQDPVEAARARRHPDASVPRLQSAPVGIRRKPFGFSECRERSIAQLRQAAIEQSYPQVVLAVLKERLDRVAGQSVLSAVKAQSAIVKARQPAALESDPQIAIVVEEQGVDVVPFNRVVDGGF